MNAEQARVALEIFIQRIELDTATGARYIRGPISEIENKALKYALTAIGGTSMLSESGETSRFKQVPQTRAAPLILASLERSVPDNPEILICLDFGTAMSKAAATKERDENLLELPLGSSAGDANTIYGLRSSLFVSRSGRIYFGHEAIAKSMNESDSERRRFDSLKQQLSQGELTDLSEKFLDVAINPTNVPLSHADAILLYLAYLTDMATSELASRYGLSRYVRRRFARPCWESNRAAWAMDEMRMMLAKAQIIADTFHGKWKGGIPADEAKATLDVVDGLDQKPEYLIGEGVEEPIAAGSSRMVADETDRGLFIVVDIGAGTTDFAAFWANQDPDKDLFKVWQVRGTVSALSQAGDTIDGYLQTFILEKANLKPGNNDYQFAATRLLLEIRQAKETLFRRGEVDVVLSNSTPVKIIKQEFLESKAVQDFAHLLRDRFVASLNAADKTWFDLLASFERVGRGFITVVLTGGGSELPMAKELATEFVEVHGRRFACKGAPTVPDWIRDEFPGLSGEYPQLAVAIGGAARQLPELAPETPRVEGLSGKSLWESTTLYK